MIRDKDRISDMTENQAKRLLVDNLRLLAEDQKTASGAEATRLISTFASIQITLLEICK